MNVRFSLADRIHSASFNIVLREHPSKWCHEERVALAPEEPRCHLQDKATGWVCTLEKNHRGTHVAANSAGPLLIWGEYDPHDRWVPKEETVAVRSGVRCSRCGFRDRFPHGKGLFEECSSMEGLPHSFQWEETSIKKEKV